jgi:uncharacterized damage-inducible protein DinB
MAETSPAPSLRALALGDLEHELRGTRAVLERLPEAQLGWKPHERSFPLGALAAHAANLPWWMLRILQDDAFDLAGPRPNLEPPASVAEVLERFDRNAAALLEGLGEADDARLAARWELRRGGEVVAATPRHAALRGFGISHLVHHRGQLTVYLRVLEVPVPGLYGPSADERAS